MDYNIDEYFINLLQESSSLDIAEAEFRRALADDDDLKNSYRLWCEENGYPEKSGFTEFCQEYIEGRNELWNSLTDFDDEE